MPIEQIRRALAARPFKPFTMHMDDGREFSVIHPKLLALIPGMERTVILGFPAEEAVEIIDLLHVTSLSIGNGHARRRKAG